MCANFLPTFSLLSLALNKVVRGQFGLSDDGHGVILGVLRLQLTHLTDIDVITDEAKVAYTLKRRAPTDSTSHTGMLSCRRLASKFFLAHSHRDLLLNLGLNHLDEELFMLSVDSARTATATTWVRSTFLGLATIAAEAGNRLRGTLLIVLEL